MPDEPTQSGRCWTCGYLLRGIASTRCPECGREFDPDDPATMNVGQPLSWTGRKLLLPIGWPLASLAILATALIAWTTGWPLSFDERCLDWPFLKNWIWPAGARPDATPAWRLFASSLAAALVALILVILRLALRQILLIRFRPPAEHRRRRWLPITCWFMCMLVSMLFLNFGGSRRIGREWVADAKIVASAPVGWRSPGPWQPPLMLTLQQETQIIRMLVLHGQDAYHRRWGCKILVERRPGQAMELLSEAVERERDPELIALELRLLGMMYDRIRGPRVLEKFIDDPRPAVATAALDAMGVLFDPEFSIRSGHSRLGQSPTRVSGDPPIELTGFVRANSSIALAPALRDRLESIMLGSRDLETREAAARAILPHAPPNHNLRIAEWGVWLAENGDLKTARDIAGEIPPFVHRCGNPIAEMSERIYKNSFTVITKPVIHVSASRAMAVDIEVRIRAGRPWFVYPMPDDFEAELVEADHLLRRVIASTRTAGTWPTAMTLSTATTQPAFLKPLDNPSIGTLPAAKLRSGYPWLQPRHRQLLVNPFTRSSVPIPVDDIVEMGVHWQSIIVSPKKLDWMKEPAVGDDPKFAWWKRLRDVDCSWVSSRGESEKFLYYDGPTLLKTPLKIRLANDQLHFAPRQKESEADEILGDPEHRRRPPRPDTANHPPDLREGMWIEVKENQIRGAYVSSAHFGFNDAPKTPRYTGPEVEKKFLAVLVDRGLTPSEAAGLIDCWRQPFFEKPGKRFLLILSSDDYDQFCPIVIKPRPTQLIRVGIVTYEF